MSVTWKAWSESEIRTVQRWADAGHHASDIAAGLDGRSKSAVRNLMDRLGIANRTTPRNSAESWNEDEDDDRVDESWVVRCEVYEVAIGKTRGEIIAAMRGTYGPRLIDRALEELTTKWCGFRPVLAKPSCRGRYARVEDKDMLRPGPYEPIQGGIRRIGRPGSAIRAA